MVTSGLTVGLASLLIAAVVHAPSSSPAPPKPEEVTLRGTVVTLAEALKSVRPDIKADAELIAKQVVLLGEDGAIVPLLSDDAGRALFQDQRLRNRPVEIRGRRYAGVPYLQVVTLRVEEEGRLQVPEYYCNICTISVRFPQICPCCQGPMELRMKPDRH